jgi:hypothetical protein
MGAAAFAAALAFLADGLRHVRRRAIRGCIARRNVGNIRRADIRNRCIGNGCVGNRCISGGCIGNWCVRLAFEIERFLNVESAWRIVLLAVVADREGIAGSVHGHRAIDRRPVP